MNPLLGARSRRPLPAALLGFLRGVPIPLQLKQPLSRRKGTLIQRRQHWLNSLRHSHTLHNCIQERPQPANPAKHRTINVITIIGPRDMKVPGAVNTTSHSSADWSTGLSPFSLGPVDSTDRTPLASSKTPGNSPSSIQNTPTQTVNPPTRYWTWAQNGWKSTKPFRYPFGKRRKPLCSLWNGHRLDYIAARKQIYLPLYQEAVKHTRAYQMLEHLYLGTGTTHTL